VKLSLWRADAIVLFDWLMSTDLNTVPITHPAQKQALADLLSRLEFDTDTDITGSTAEEIAAARQHMQGGSWNCTGSAPGCIRAAVGGYSLAWWTSDGGHLPVWPCMFSIWTERF
jgi:hypothetical protein